MYSVFVVGKVYLVGNIYQKYVKKGHRVGLSALLNYVNSLIICEIQLGFASPLYGYETLYAF